MATIPQFQPAAASGTGFAQSQSLMQRASANRRQEEVHEMERQKFEIMRPVLESEARLQLVSQANDLTASKIINDSLTTDLQLFPEYVKQWTETARIEDPKERLSERRRVLGAITPFASIKSTAPMVKAFQEQFAQDAMADKTAEMASAQLNLANVNNDAKAAKAAADNEVKMAKQQMDMQVAQMKADQAMQLKNLEIERREQELEKKIASTEKIAADRSASMKNRPREQAALKFNQEIASRVDAATTELPKFQRALELLEDPAVRTGTGAGIETATRRLGEIFGIEMGRAANLEELQSTLGSSFLNYVGQMKGAVSDKETAALMAMSPGVGKTAAGNIALVSNIIKTLSRNAALGQLVLEERQAGEATEMEIQNAVMDAMLNTPIDAFVPVRPAASEAPTSSGLTPQEQTRLQELRAKLGR